MQSEPDGLDGLLRELVAERFRPTKKPTAPVDTWAIQLHRQQVLDDALDGAPDPMAPADNVVPIRGRRAA